MTTVRRLFYWLILFGFFATFSAPLMANENKFIQLIASLDEPRGLCIDIRGHRDRVKVNRPLVLHTCKRGIWNLDEQFDVNAFKVGLLKMPAYHVCAQRAHGKQNKFVILGSCGNRRALWVFKDDRLKLAARPKLCLTAGPGPSQLTRGGKRLPSRHVSRSLLISPCKSELGKRQKWKLTDIN